MRTQEEILARVQGLTPDDDMFGFERGVLIEALDFAHAKPFLKPDATPSDWVAVYLNTREKIESCAKEYLAFAFTKAEDHRGLSAMRSIFKMRAFTWLLGRDDVVTQVDEAPHAMYGVPALVLVARAFGWPIPESPALARMALGQACEPGCEQGCGT